MELHVGADKVDQVDPARAGMVHFRRRGDGRQTRRPRAWGWLQVWVDLRGAPHIDPEHAGMVPGWAPRTRPVARRPSASRDGSVEHITITVYLESPPRVRGWLSLAVGLMKVLMPPLRVRGIVRTSCTGPWTPPCRPRTRGDSSAGESLWDKKAVSTPYVRGWIPDAGPVDHRHPVVPARAGMDPRRYSVHFPRPRRARTRGHSSSISVGTLAELWSTLHARG